MVDGILDRRYLARGYQWCVWVRKYVSADANAQSCAYKCACAGQCLRALAGKLRDQYVEHVGPGAFHNKHLFDISPTFFAKHPDFCP